MSKEVDDFLEACLEMLAYAATTNGDGAYVIEQATDRLIQHDTATGEVAGSTFLSAYGEELIDRLQGTAGKADDLALVCRRMAGVMQTAYDARLAAEDEETQRLLDEVLDEVKAGDRAIRKAEKDAKRASVKRPPRKDLN
jgi:hypothetical protein